MVHFISFASLLFYPTLRRIEKEAKESGFFNFVKTYNEENLSSDILNYCLSNHRGYGFWIWKPYIVNEYMNSMNDNDILVFCDAGCHINVRGKKRFDEYLEILKTNDIITFELGHKNKSWTKMDTFVKLNSLDLLEYSQMVGGIFLLKKTDNTVSFVKEWLDICINNKNLIDDSPSLIKNDPTFNNNRHDQSIFSLLIRRRNPVIFSDETYEFSKSKNYSFPLNATRFKGDFMKF